MAANGLYQLRDHTIWEYAGGSPPTWNKLDDHPTITVVAQGNNLYQLRTDHTIWQYAGGSLPTSPPTSPPTWKKLDDNPQTTLIVAGGNNLYQLQLDHSIWQYAGGTPPTSPPTWKKLDDNPQTTLIVAGGNNLYQLHSDHSIWQYAGGSLPTSPPTSPPIWNKLDDNPQTTLIVAGGNNLYQLHLNHTIWQYGGRGFHSWNQLDNNPSEIAAGGNNLYQLRFDHSIWQYTGGNPPIWNQLDNNLSTVEIAASDNGSLYQLRSDHSILEYAGGSLSTSPPTSPPIWKLLDKTPTTSSIISSGGAANTRLAEFDQQFISLLTRHRVPGATVAASYNGHLFIERGYGLLDRNDPNSQTMAYSRFRIASVSKPITAMTILALIQAGTGGLTLNTNVWNLLSPKYPLLSGRTPTAGINQITVQHLLTHTAGWDNQVYDPMFDVDNIAWEVGVSQPGVSRPADRAMIISYMWSHPLAHPPPGRQHSYANFNYCLLGRVIEEVTGQTYADAVATHLSVGGWPVFISTALGKSLLSDRSIEEAMYFDYPGAPLVSSVFPPFNQVPAPYGGFDLENMDSHGGWISNTQDLLAFMHALFLRNLLSPATQSQIVTNRVPIPNDPSGTQFYGLGWNLTAVGTTPAGTPIYNWWHTGSLPGTTSFIVYTKLSSWDVCWVALLNSRDCQNAIVADLDSTLWAAVKNYLGV